MTTNLSSRQRRRLRTIQLCEAVGRCRWLSRMLRRHLMGGLFSAFAAYSHSQIVVVSVVGIASVSILSALCLHRRLLQAELDDSDGFALRLLSEGNGISACKNASRRRRGVVVGGRFPRYGSRAYSDRCGWVVRAAASAPASFSHVESHSSSSSSSSSSQSQCTFYYGPSKLDSEGLSFWASQLVASYLLALQAHCRFVFDYGPSVDLAAVLQTPPDPSAAAASASAAAAASASASASDSLQRRDDGPDCGMHDDEDDEDDDDEDEKKKDKASWEEHESMEATVTNDQSDSSPGGPWSRERCDADPNCYEIPHPRGVDLFSKKKTLTFDMDGNATTFGIDASGSSRNGIGNDSARLKRLAPVPLYRYAYSVPRHERFHRRRTRTIRPDGNVIANGKGNDDDKDEYEDENIKSHADIVLADELDRALPGFRLEDGMACTLGYLLRLSRNASQYEPDLFSTILPTLRGTDHHLHEDGDDDGEDGENNTKNKDSSGGETLTLGVYIRTQYADHSRASHGYSSRLNSLKNGTELPPDLHERYVREATRVLDDAFEVERGYMSGRFTAAGGDDDTDYDNDNENVNGYLDEKTGNNVGRRRNITKVVWMVAIDCPHLKPWIRDTYGGKDAYYADDATVANASSSLSPSSQPPSPPKPKIPRTVLTTRSRGRHTRSSEEPDTDAFAEAFLDWYLLGETDAIVYRMLSFGETAALRTSRPLYKKGYYNPFYYVDDDDDRRRRRRRSRSHRPRSSTVL